LALFCCCPILLAIILPAFSREMTTAKVDGCMLNQKSLVQGLLMYAEEHDDTLPATGSWEDLTDHYAMVNKDYHCPELADGTPGGGYAMLQSLSSKTVGSVPNPKGQVAVFETTVFHRNATDEMTSLPVPGRHKIKYSGNVFGYLDGHADYIRDGSKP